MKIGYGTYGMPEVPVWAALPRLAKMGYEAVEICAAERWPTAPGRLAAADRERLRELLGELGLEFAALLLFVNLLAPAGEDLDRQGRFFGDACGLARDLSGQPGPVVVSPLGRSDLEWEQARPVVFTRVARFAEIAAREGCRFALEPHVHGLLDRPERVLDVLEQVRSPALGINFDISHFAVGGYPRAETIRSLAPFALHTHVKDGRMEEGKVRFLLPGEGDFDYEAYFREMAAAGYTGCVTAEVSVQIFDAPGYDPWSAAHFCLENLARARRVATEP